MALKVTDAPLGYKEYLVDNGTMSISVLDQGATLTEINVLNKQGMYDNVIIKVPYEIYQKNYLCFGATLGRVAGRIKYGQALINDKVIKLKKNYKGTTLHGGEGFHFKKYDYVDFIENDDECRLTFSYKSKALEGGFPGNMVLFVNFVLRKNTLRIEYEAVSDEDTLCNISNHIYFNLSPMELCYDMKLLLEADECYLNTKTGLPIKLINVKNTGYDFNTLSLFKDNFEAIKTDKIKNFDNLYLLKEAARISLIGKASGIRMDVTTSYKACQLYDNDFHYHKGDKNIDISAICIECQKKPYDIKALDNEIMLKKNEKYKEFIEYSFSNI